MPGSLMKSFFASISFGDLASSYLPNGVTPMTTSSSKQKPRMYDLTRKNILGENHKFCGFQ